MASYTIQKIDTALLEEYVSKLQDSFSSFKTSHNDYKNSYLMQKTEASLVSMADKIDEIYKELETGYENILKWWKDYNENAVGLDQCIARKGNRIKEGVLSSFASAHFSDLSTYKLTMSNVIAYNYKNNAQYTYNVNAKTSLTGTNDIHKEENTNPSMEQIHSQMEASVTGATKVRLANAFANSASIIKDVVMNNKIESSLSQEKFQYKPRDLTEYKSVLSEEEWQNLLEEEKQMGMQVATLKNQNEDLKGALGRLQYKYGQVCFTANNMYQGQVRPLPEEWLNYLDKEMATKIRNAQANTIDYTTVFNQILMDKTGCKNYEKYLGKVEELKTNISEMEGSIQYLEQLYKVLPYVCISGTKDYHLFSKENKYNYNLDYNAYKLMEEAYSMHQESLPTFTLDKDYIQKRNLEFVSRFKKLGISEVEDFEEFSTTYFLSEENRKMYFYLKEKDPSLANKYITELSDTINQAKGAAEAILFLENLDENKVMNFLKTFNQGTGDGIQTFFDGLENVIKADGVLSVEDYKKIVILQILSEDQALKKALLKDKENLQIERNRKMLELLTIAEERNYKKYLPGTYQFSTSFGNMIPSIAASAITSFFATPAGGAAVMGGTTGSSAIATQAVGKVVGTGLMGLSATGNATEGAMQQGYGKFESYVYGAFNGLSEATLQYFLGSIPGLSRLEGFTLGRLLSEGIEEGSQEYVDAILRKCILGQEIDIEEVIQNSGRSFLMGVTMSAFINGGQTVIRYGGKKVVLTMDKISQMYKSGDVETILSSIQDNDAISNNLEILQDKIGEDMFIVDDSEDVDATGKYVPIKNLLAVIQDENIYNKFSTDFEQNLEFFGRIDKSDYFLGIEQLLQTLTKNQYDVEFTPVEIERANTLIEQFHTLKETPRVFENMQDFIKADLSQTIANHTVINGMQIDTKEARQMQSSIQYYLKYCGKINESIALKMNDPKQYFIAKIRTLLFEVKKVEELKNLVSAIDISRAHSGNIDFYQLLPLMNQSLTETDKTNIYNMLGNSDILFNKISKPEIDAIKLYTATAGPFLVAYQRNAKTKFRGSVCDGTDVERIQKDLANCFEYCISKNILTDENFDIIASIEGLENAMQSVIKKSGPVQESLKVYRAVEDLYFDGKAIIPKIGTRFNDPAFVSTALLEQGAMKNRKIFMEIDVPAGAKGAYIEPFSGIRHYGQQEFLLDKNQTFEITGMECTKDGQIKLQAKVVLMNEITAYELDTVHFKNKTKLYDRYYKNKVGVNQVELNDVIAKMKQENLMDRFHEEIVDLNKKGLYNFNFAEHNQDHAERVLFYAMYLGNLLGMEAKNYDVLVEAAKFHDIGRGISKDNHALASAMQMDAVLQNKYETNDLSLIKAAIELHEMNYENNLNVFWNICQKYNIDNNQVNDLYQVANVLKDADALDRIRFPGNLKQEYLRTNEAKSMIKAVNEFHEIRGEKKLKDMLNSNTIDTNVKLYIQNAIKNGESAYRTWFNLHYKANW